MKFIYFLFFLYFLNSVCLQAQGPDDRIIFHYLKLSAALTQSNLQKALKQAGQLAPECAASGLKSLQFPAEAMAKATRLEELREKFSPFSDSLRAAIQQRKIKPAEELYLIHCPMAFQDKGADWISDVPKVVNPYFGDEMLHCGKVKMRLSTGSK